jgi:hypothetical protein
MGLAHGIAQVQQLSIAPEKKKQRLRFKEHRETGRYAVSKKTVGRHFRVHEKYREGKSRASRAYGKAAMKRNLCHLEILCVTGSQGIVIERVRSNERA